MTKSLKALEEYKNGLEMTEEEIGIIENELKALEIIKTVCPNIFWVVRTKTYREYKRKCKDDTLLENDYYLLREVLL